MLKIGIAGIGFMGMVHYLSYARLRGVRVAAVCDRSPQKLAGDWRSIQGNFGPRGERMDLTGVATYEDIDELIADETLDAVDLTLPPALHAEAACRALAAGKHVFCEKPMSLNLAYCQKMSRTAERAGKRLLVGHVLPYFPEYSWALREVSNGKHGALLGGSFKRVISDPAWLDAYWDADQIGGPMLDLHVHDAHYIGLLFGRPTSVQSSGRLRGEQPEFWNSQFDFESGARVTATSGVIDQQGRPFQQAFEIHCERATLTFDFAVIGKEAGYLCPPTLLTEKGAVKRPKLSGGDPMDAFTAELRDVVRCFDTGATAPALAADLACDAIALCHAQTKSMRSGRRVKLH